MIKAHSNINPDKAFVRCPYNNRPQSRLLNVSLTLLFTWCTMVVLWQQTAGFSVQTVTSLLQTMIILSNHSQVAKSRPWPTLLNRPEFKTGKKKLDFRSWRAANPWYLSLLSRRYVFNRFLFQHTTQMWPRNTQLLQLLGKAKMRWRPSTWNLDKWADHLSTRSNIQGSPLYIGSSLQQGWNQPDCFTVYSRKWTCHRWKNKALILNHTCRQIKM